MSADEQDRLIRTIYAGACDDEAFLQALKLLAERHACMSAVFVYTDRDLPNADIVMTYGPLARPEVRQLYLLEFAAHDPAPKAMADLPVGTASATGRLFTPAFTNGSKFVTEFYRPLGLEEALGGPAIASGGRTGLVAIQRGGDRAPFSDDEIANFGPLLLHFGEALKLRRTFFATLSERRALADALDGASQAVLVVGSKADLLHANAKARELLARADGLTLTRSGTFAIDDEHADQRLRHAIASPQPAAIIRVPRHRNMRPYAVRVTSNRDPLSGSSCVVVYIFDPDHCSPDGMTAIKEVFGLSHQAASLVSNLLCGGDLAAYAAASGVSMNTAKFHLKAAFAATGTTRQADLVMLVTGLLRDCGGPQPLGHVEPSTMIGQRRPSVDLR